MRKVSEMLELGMPTYEACPRRFMCCVMTDDYAINNAERLGFSDVESKNAKEMILKRIDCMYTLDSYLVRTDAEYAAYRYDGDTVIGDYYDELPHGKRVAFYKAFIEELKGKGE